MITSVVAAAVEVVMAVRIAGLTPIGDNVTDELTNSAGPVMCGVRSVSSPSVSALIYFATNTLELTFWKHSQ